jgi:pimeloyl-ACP methyl ester carboxylesterase
VVHFIPSTGGVRVAVHDLGGPADPAPPVILFSHATGFHARVWAPMASHLTDRFRCLAIDYRGHGLAETPEEIDFDWHGFGDDAVALLDSDLPAGTPVHGVGHSMGGAALVLAAARRPGVLTSLWLFEPIVPPPGSLLSSDGPNPLAESALRRRPTFESYDAAIANYGSKPPLDQLHPDALREYVEGGFAPQPDGTVALRCRPEWEAATFSMARSSGAWDVLSQLDLPVTVLVGEEEEFGPAAFGPAIAEVLPRGELAEHRELGHFGPLEEPGKLAAELAAWIDGLAR